MTALLTGGVADAQNVAPVASSKNLPLGTATAEEVSAETRAILQAHVQRNRAADLDVALRLEDEAAAQRLVDEMFRDAAAVSEARTRIRMEDTGRTEAARIDSVTYLRRRLRGEAALTEAPESFRSRVVVEDPVTGNRVVRTTTPRYYDGNTRVVTYRNLNDVPPVLIASSKLNRINLQPIAGSPYATELVAVERRPETYLGPEAYAVSYAVDPGSEVTRDDILFEQGSTGFKDAYSYDLVVDLAMAINDPAFAAANFVVEGHSSAEGDYNENLALSQARAERIVREMVRYGVPASRLIPIGYGENEAQHAAGAADFLRSTDRRVALYRMK